MNDRLDKEGFLKKGFEMFSDAYIPDNAPHHQQRDMRAAFYFGAQLLLHGLRDAVVGAKSGDEVKIALDALLDELSEFAMEELSIIEAMREKAHRDMREQ
jgi:hypothetical protein